MASSLAFARPANFVSAPPLPGDLRLSDQLLLAACDAYQSGHVALAQGLLRIVEEQLQRPEQV